MNTMCRQFRSCVLLGITLLVGACGGGSGGAIAPSTPTPPPPPPPAQNQTLDLLGLASGNGFLRVSGTGAEGDGRFGVPVAAGLDIDGDGIPDYAKANMLDSPLGRTRAGSVIVVFGNGIIDQDIDTAMPNANVLSIYGEGIQEATGGEIWMADLTGDSIGEIIIGRPNFRASLPDRIGAGALTIIVGSAVLRDMATNGTPLDLSAPPANVNVVTLVGAAELDRFGFWMREGDISGDGIDDLLIGADQEDNGGANNSGAAYVVRGGVHLNASLTIDMADFGSTALAGHILRVLPPPASESYHFGSTVAVMDLDNNARSEVLVSASLNRAGGVLLAEGAAAGTAVGSGGNIGGTVFILWDDNIPTDPLWPAGLTFTMDSAPMSTTRIDGGSIAGQFTNDRFGEEMIGGLDYNGDGIADVFFGDITGEALGRVNAGTGHLFFSAADLRNRDFSMDNVPADLTVTTFYGPEDGAISSDTTLHGDFDNDGIDDLGIGSPTADPQGRMDAGIVHVVWGRAGSWPAVVDFQEGLKPDPAELRITDILGANGEQSANDRGDTLMYSAVATDMDGDGRDDLVINEMRGNGIDAAALDVGNLLIIGGATIPKQ